MAQSWKALKGEYDARLESIGKAKVFLAEKEKQYEAETKPAKDFIERENVGLCILRDQEVSINVAEVIDELAKVVGARDNVIFVKTAIAGSRSYSGTRENLDNQLYVDMKKRGAKGEVMLTISGKDNEYFTIEFPIEFYAVQRDGRLMGECIDIVPNKLINYNRPWMFELNCGFGNLVVKHKMCELLGSGYQGYCKYYPEAWRQAVVNVLERQHESSQESVMGDE